MQHPSASVFQFSYAPGPQETMRVFHSEAGQRAQVYLAIGAGLFELEKHLRHAHFRRARFNLPGLRGNEDTISRIAVILRDLVRYVLVEDIEFELSPVSMPQFKKIKTEIDLSPSKNVCLFSGGVDSYVGLAWARARLKHVDSVFCAHADQSWTIKLTNRLYGDLFKDERTRMRQVYVPAISKEGYAQLRGFLYMLSAAAWIDLLRAERLIITEVGPTMHQPKFAPFDSVTMTTHPYVLEGAAETMSLLLGRTIQVVTPFADMTKAEVIALAPQGPGIKMSHSCISQRFGEHDGTCYGCVVRRLGAIASGIRDVTYKRNPIADENASRGNLLSLLRFSIDFLTRPEEMPEYQVGDIFRFRKKDLFKRFCLDNLAALHSLALSRSRLAPDVDALYHEAVAELGGPTLLEERLSRLRSKPGIERTRGAL